MSALQKYKQEAKRLEEENQKLREENAGLQRRIQHPAQIVADGDLEARFLHASVEITKRLTPLAHDRSGYPLMASIIESALHEAYNLGKTDNEKTS